MLRYLGFVLSGLLVVGASAAPLQAGSIRVGHRLSPAAREREIARNERFYQRLSAFRSSRPSRFDRAHPFYGRLLTDREFFDYYYERWQASPARFEYYHPCAWKVLDGGAHLNPPGPGGQEVNPPPPPIPQEPNPPEPPIPGPLVPEPSSMMLVATGAGLLLVARAASRRFRRGS